MSIYSDHLFSLDEGAVITEGKIFNKIKKHVPFFRQKDWGKQLGAGVLGSLGGMALHKYAGEKLGKRGNFGTHLAASMIGNGIATGLYNKFKKK